MGCTAPKSTLAFLLLQSLAVTLYKGSEPARPPSLPAAGGENSKRCATTRERGEESCCALLLAQSLAFKSSFLRDLALRPKLAPRRLPSLHRLGC